MHLRGCAGAEGAAPIWSFVRILVGLAARCATTSGSRSTARIVSGALFTRVQGALHWCVASEGVEWACPAGSDTPQCTRTASRCGRAPHAHGVVHWAVVQVLTPLSEWQKAAFGLKPEQSASLAQVSLGVWQENSALKQPGCA